MSAMLCVVTNECRARCAEVRSGCRSSAGVLARFFVVAYLGVGLPPVLLAAATNRISSRSALIVFSAVILAVSVIAARLQATALRRSDGGASVGGAVLSDTPVTIMCCLLRHALGAILSVNQVAGLPGSAQGGAWISMIERPQTGDPRLRPLHCRGRDVRRSQQPWAHSQMASRRCGYTNPDMPSGGRPGIMDLTVQSFQCHNWTE